MWVIGLGFSVLQTFLASPSPELLVKFYVTKRVIRWTERERYVKSVELVGMLAGMDNGKETAAGWSG
jgi:hypothetical protein